MNILEEAVVNKLQTRKTLSAYTLILELFGYEETKNPDSYDLIAETMINLQNMGKVKSVNNGFGEYTYTA